MAQGYMEIGEPWLSIIVTVAGVLILSGWVQQLVKGYRTKSLKDISRYLLLLILAGATSVGFLINSESVSPYKTVIPEFSHFSIVFTMMCRPTAVVASAAGRKYRGKISAPITP